MTARWKYVCLFFLCSWRRGRGELPWTHTQVIWLAAQIKYSCLPRGMSSTAMKKKVKQRLIIVAVKYIYCSYWGACTVLEYFLFKYLLCLSKHGSLAVFKCLRELEKLLSDWKIHIFICSERHFATKQLPPWLKDYFQRQ